MLNTCTMQSRIPVRSRHNFVRERTASAPSKLEQLAEKFKQKLLLEKERKIVAFHLENQNRSLQRLGGGQNAGANAVMRNGYGSAGSILDNRRRTDSGLGQQNSGILRTFFKERRALENGSVQNPHLQQNVNHHYRQKKAARFGEDLNGGSYGAKPPRPNGKNSAGRDKSNPLQALDRKTHHRRYSDSPVNMENGTHQDSNLPPSHRSPKPPPFEKKPKMVRQHRRGSYSSYSSGSDSPVPDASSLPSDRALVPINSKPQRVHRDRRGEGATAVTNDSENLPHTGPNSPSKRISNYKKWQLEQESNREQRQNSGNKNRQEVGQTWSPNQFSPKSKHPEKMSDFQKFQMEQDQAKAERLRKFNEQKQQETPHTDGWHSNRDAVSNRTPKSGRAVEPISNNSSARTPTTRKPPPSERTQQRKQSILKNTRILSRQDMDDDEEEVMDERKRKEAELIAKIEARQRELDRMKKQRQKDDQEAVRERERQKQKATKLREHQRRQSEREEQERNWSQASRVDHHDDYSTRDDALSRVSSRREAASRGASEKSYRRTSPPPSKSRSKPPTRRVPSERQPTPNNENTAFYLEMAATEGAIEDVSLASCPNCGRNFAADRLAKHTKVCRSASKKKRKVFDPVKMRTVGTEQAKYAREFEIAKREKKPSKTKWRAQHENFIKSIRYAKKVTEVEAQGGNLADLPPPPVTENPDYKQCPHCSRKFNPATAERHIPRCKDIKARPAPPRQRRR